MPPFGASFLDPGINGSKGAAGSTKGAQRSCAGVRKGPKGGRSRARRRFCRLKRNSTPDPQMAWNPLDKIRRQPGVSSPRCLPALVGLNLYGTMPYNEVNDLTPGAMQ